MHQLRQFATGGFIDPMEPTACTLGAIDVDTIHEQHVKVNIQIQRTAEALDQRDRTVSAVFLVKPAL
jgi:hypothetical protein